MALALLSACNLFDTTTVVNKAENERKLKDLQWALLIPSSSPPAEPTAAPPAGGETATPGADPAAAPAGAAAETPAVPAAPGAEPAAPVTPPTAGTEPAAAPPNTPATGEQSPSAAAAAAEGGAEASAVLPVEHDATKAVPTTVAVIAVVDTFTETQATEGEDPAERAKKMDLAQRRERVVRQELQNVLVANNMITVVQPNEAQIAAARAEIGTTNSGALSNTMLPNLAETLGVKHVVTALIDLDGGEVNVVAQHAPDGTIVFQDTLINWDVVLAVAKEAAAEAAKAAKAGQ